MTLETTCRSEDSCLPRQQVGKHPGNTARTTWRRRRTAGGTREGGGKRMSPLPGLRLRCGDPMGVTQIAPSSSNSTRRASTEATRKEPVEEVDKVLFWMTGNLIWPFH